MTDGNLQDMNGPERKPGRIGSPAVFQLMPDFAAVRCEAPCATGS